MCKFIDILVFVFFLFRRERILGGTGMVFLSVFDFIGMNLENFKCKIRIELCRSIMKIYF